MRYINNTQANIEIDYEANSVPKHVVLEPGQHITFDCEAENGDNIRQQLIAAGATQV